MKYITRTRLLWGTVLAFGLVAIVIPWVSQFRILSPESSPADEISVTSKEDGGAGSLREAIFAGAKNAGKTLIRIKVREIILKTPLPPLVNAQGIDIDGGESRGVIDAGRLPKGAVVLDISTPGTHISSLQIRNAAEQAILVRESGARIKGVSLANCAEGIYFVDGVQDAVIEQSSFEGNGTAIHLQPGVSRVIVKNNTFSRQKKASIWAVSPRPRDAMHVDLTVRGNGFRGDFQSIVLIHAQGEVMDNSFEEAEDAAVYLVGSGSMAKNNRLSNGKHFGFSIDSSSGLVIEENEIDRNAGGGILLQSSNGVNIRRNKLYGNGYGVAVLFGSRTNPNIIADNLLLQQRQDGLYVVGGSPILRDNVIKQSGGAGIRLLAYAKPNRELLTPYPLLGRNELSENAGGDLAQGSYSEKTAPRVFRFELRLDRDIVLGEPAPQRRQ